MVREIFWRGFMSGLIVGVMLSTMILWLYKH
jgi:hypothetical protein